MNKMNLAYFLIFSSLYSSAQTIFAENFETNPNLLNSGWVIYDDGNTPNGYQDIFLHAWEVVDWAEETPNLAASTTSTFIEIAPADRWLVTPPISIPSNAISPVLSFKARCFDIAPHQDGFKLKVSTTTNAKLAFNTTLLNVANTSNTLLSQVPVTTVDLSTYIGQTIYLAWIDDYFQGNILAIDDIDIGMSGLGTNQFLTNSYSVYPNPTNKFVFIKSETNTSEIQVFDIQGKLLFQNNTDNLETKIDFSNYENGLYFVKIKSLNQFETYKIIKQ